MRPEDAPEVHALATRAFEALEGPEPPGTPERLAAAHLRITHLVATDPDGAWIAHDDSGRLAGAALALRRERLWGLSLLVVDPGTQSRGTGARLLAAALDTARDATGAIILASRDPRALRLYARAGFAPHPTLEATGPVRRLPPWPAEVRRGDAADRPLTERIDRVVRGAPHGPDVEIALAQGAELLAVEERGYALVTDGTVRLLAALDGGAAQDLLRAALAATPPGASAQIDWIGADQGWAVPVVLEAGLELKPSSAVFRRGETGTFSPYLPSGAWL